MNRNRHSAYLDELFGENGEFDLAVKKTSRLINYLRRRKVPIDYIAVRGGSGSIMGGAVSYNTGIPLIFVRKNGVSSHASYDAEGVPYGQFHYIIVDDFIATGATVSAIIENITASNKQGRLIGVIQYNSGHSDFLGNEYLHRRERIGKTLGSLRLDSNLYKLPFDPRKAKANFTMEK